jgi:site-specific DNA-cytosine methylase
MQQHKTNCYILYIHKTYMFFIHIIKKHMSNYKHAAIVPLMGGFSIAATNVLGVPPEIILSYEPFFNNDKLYLNYLASNGHYPPYFQIDKLEKEKKIKDIQHFAGRLDIVHGVFPCSGLSMAGNLKKGERSTSPVNDWMINGTNFVLEVLRPNVFVFENAPNLSSPSGDIVRKKLMEIARYHGYAGTFYKTDTLLHGIPQRRPRTYTILHKGNKAPILEYYRKDAPSIAEYLKDIPKDATLQNKYATKEPHIKDFEVVRFLKQKFGNNWREEILSVKDHLCSYGYMHKKGMLEEYEEFIKELGDQAHPTSVKDIAHVIKKLGMGKNYRLSHRVLLMDKDYVYAVIGELMERNVHPTEDRRMNIREYLHLMGMPHDFEIDDPRDYPKLTQNCPVGTNEDITKEIVAIIEGKRDFSSERFEMQNNIKYDGAQAKRLF